MGKLIVVRHGQTDWNAQNRVQGHTDIPLNDLGREQARELRETLSLDEINICLHSPLSRARETAEIICGGTVKLVAEPLAIERDLGDYEGKSFGGWAAAAELWSFADMDYIDSPNCESLARLMTRAGELIKKLKAEHKDETVLLVSHAGFIRALHFSFAGYTPYSDASSFRVEHGKIYQYHF